MYIKSIQTIHVNYCLHWSSLLCCLLSLALQLLVLGKLLPLGQVHLVD